MRGKIASQPVHGRCCPRPPRQGFPAWRPPPAGCHTAPFHFRYVRKINNGHLPPLLPAGQGCDVIKWAALAQASSAACLTAVFS
ncbi:hypothetical protein E2C01_069940 [Portunus trituberculatus]|uniref:Uncharacterized protein n=1 Tax=Portunus trituberculatus TaxID=210409 RepID=A0A5B7HSW9_PORTR|nr:hypothetical protein [Portunus trituberculatus]